MPVFPLLLNIVLEIRVYTVRPQKEKLKSILINVSGECFIKKKKKLVRGDCIPQKCHRKAVEMF